MLPQCVLAFLLLATAFYAANAKERALSSSDIAAIRRICRQVVGYPVANDYNLFSQLTPFLRSKSELEHLIVNCSSQHCKWLDSSAGPSRGSPKATCPSGSRISICTVDA